MAELKARLEVCDERNNYFREHGPQYQKKHLSKRVEIARQEGWDKVAKKILAIIQREQDKSFWRKINYTCGKVKGGSPTSVQVPGNGVKIMSTNTPTKPPSMKPFGQTSTTRDFI